MDVQAHVASYLGPVHRGERRQAIDIATALLQQRVPAERVVTDLLARAQAAIGPGWQEGRWSVAMEPRASSITDSALQSSLGTEYSL